MKIGIALGLPPWLVAEDIAAIGRAVEDAGFESVWVPEHVVLFREHASVYPYSDDGRIPGNPEGVLDPFIALTMIAAHTRELRLGTGICIVPQRSAVYTAKMVADLDHLSGGRVEFGVGVGWLEEEFDALGIPFGERGARMDDALGAMVALWTQEEASFSGVHHQLDATLMYPKPAQRPHPPIVVGGESQHARRRAARLGQGWYGFGHPVAAVEGIVAEMEAELAAAGRSRDAFTIQIAPKQFRPDQLDAFRAAGTDRLVLAVGGGSADRVIERLRSVADSVGLGS